MRGQVRVRAGDGVGKRGCGQVRVYGGDGEGR